MDCLEGMKHISDNSSDLILCDLPYGVTDCKWDIVIPLVELWEQYKRVIKDNSAIILTSTQPFTTDLINSARGLFKYSLVWNKVNHSNPFLAKHQPLRTHEDVLVFSNGKPPYNPQGLIEVNKIKKQGAKISDNFGSGRRNKEYFQSNTNYPKSILNFSKAYTGSANSQLHSTQKPVELFEYLIKTYSNEGDTVLDNCMGSGTTAVAAINTKRNYIGFENDQKYFDICQGRINNVNA